MKDKTDTRDSLLRVPRISLFILLDTTCFCRPGMARENLKVTTCQFPVTDDLRSTSDHPRVLDTKSL